jgi:hypothetical protein
MRAGLPLAVTWGCLVAYLPLHLRVRAAESPPGAWLWLLLLPALAVELLYSRAETRRFPAPPGWRRWLMRGGLLVRLGVIAGHFGLLVGRTAWLHGRPDPFDALLVHWPETALLFYRSAPVPGLGLAAVSLGLYLALTVRLGRLRLTTTLGLPLAGAYVLFVLFYHFPASPLRGVDTAQAAQVEHVFPVPDGGDVDRALVAPLYPRGLRVGHDDRTVVATFGATFGKGTVVGFENGKEILGQPNLLWLDLDTRAGGVVRSDTIRQFYSECDDRAFLAPWHGATLLEVDPHAGRVIEHTLPATLRGEPVAEVNTTYYACDTQRVYVANSLNPALLVWDAARGEVAGALSLLDVPGVRMGDHVRPIARSRQLGRVYLGLHGVHEMIAVDERTLTPVGTTRFPDTPFEAVGSPDGRFVYVSAWFRGLVWKLDASTLTLQDTFDGPLHARSMALSADGAVLYAVSFVTGDLLALDAATGRPLGQRYAGIKPEALYLTDRYVYVSTATGIDRVPRAALEGASAP